MDKVRTELLYERAASAKSTLRSTSPVSTYRAIPKSFAADVCMAKQNRDATQNTAVNNGATTTNGPTAATTAAPAPAKLGGLLGSLLSPKKPAAGSRPPPQQQTVRAASASNTLNAAGRGGRRRQPRGSAFVDVPPKQYTVRAAGGAGGNGTVSFRQATGDGAYQLIVGPGKFVTDCHC